MAVNVTNLIQGPANLYAGVFQAAEPLDSAISAPYAGTAFVDVGGTLDGVTLNVDQTWSDLDADQIIDVAGTRQVKRQVSIGTKLAEPTLANLAMVLNDSAPVTAAASAFYEPQDGMAAFVPAYRALLFEGFSPAGRRRWVILRKVINTEGTNFTAKKDDQGNLSVTWKTFYVSSAIRPFRVVDQTA
jgi:hypothetical protein